MRYSSLFTDHAVLQRDMPLHVWGFDGVPDAALTLSLVAEDGTAVATTYSKVNPDGTFRFILPAVSAGGPYTLTACSGSGESISAADIMVGEVWLASGQSNMAFELRDAEPGLDDLPDDSLRCFRPHDDIGLGERTEARGQWLAATRENAAGFTAVGSFFANRLRKELGVPVGIICSANGGTRIEAWMSRQALASTVAGRRELERFARCLADPKCQPTGNCASKEQPLDPGPDAEAVLRAGTGFDDSGWGTVRLPASFSDLDGRYFNGAVWFRKTVRIPDDWIGRELQLRIPGVDKHDITYVNGVEIGRTGKDFEMDCYAAERVYTIPAGLVTDNAVTVAIRVWSFIYGGGIGTADGDFSIAPAGGDGFVDLYGDWRWNIELDFGRVAGGIPGMVAGNSNSAHALFDAKIAPLVPFAIRGAIWYQGEDNSDNSEDYEDLLGALVRDWWYRWGQGDFPFIAVQLAGFGAKAEFNRRSGWSEVRDAMRRLSFKLPEFGIVSALDVGSVTEIHPKDKKTVGTRLADWALNKVYGRDDLVPTGPRFVSAVRDGSSVILKFEDVGQGLCVRGFEPWSLGAFKPGSLGAFKPGSLGALEPLSLGALKPLSPGALEPGSLGALKPGGFFIADGGGRFCRADAEIIGANKIKVTSALVKSPVEVRYAWAKNPLTANLAGSTGLPASPFRVTLSDLSYFDRSKALLGAEGFQALSSARGIVFGVGGVGSWCAEALARTGIGHLKLVDPDVVTVTNVNRQLPAAASTLGRYKVEVMKERLTSIIPEADIEISTNRYTASEPEFTAEELKKFDFIIDAIDSVEDKANLILSATSAGIPVYSSMGAALRLDPAKIRTGSFKSVSGDKLAKALRNRFRKTGDGTVPNFQCVFTDEPPMQSETLGSLMQVTASFGMCLAHLAVSGLGLGSRSQSQSQSQSLSP